MSNFYCTIIDKNYVLRGLTLYNSFAPYLDNKLFGFFCIDEEAVQILSELNLKNSWIVGPSEFETEALLSIKNKRAISEYCWTCKPAVLIYAANREPLFDWLVYLDSDMMAFSDPDVGLPEKTEINVCLTLHNPCNQYYADMIPTVGKCNAGYAGFKNNEIGLKAAQWWLDRCLELCPKFPTAEAYADQKYLDFLGHNFDGVYYSAQAGLNSGPWNTVNAQISIQDEKILINGSTLMLFHFQGFKAYGNSVFDLYTASIKISVDLKKHIFLVYVKAMKQALVPIQRHYDDRKVNFDPFASSLRRVLSEIKRYFAGKSNLIRH